MPGIVDWLQNAIYNIGQWMPGSGQSKFLYEKGGTAEPIKNPPRSVFAGTRRPTQAPTQAPTPTPTPTPQPPVPQPTPTIIPEFQQVRPDIQQMIRDSLVQASLQDQINNFINLSSRESSLDPSKIQQERNDFIPELGRKSRDYGLFQFNDWWQRKFLEQQGLTPESLLDPQTAINAMIELYRQKGYSQHPNTARGLGLL